MAMNHLKMRALCFLKISEADYPVSPSHALGERSP